MPEMSHVGGKMQSNMRVQGRCAEVASGFCNDLNEPRDSGARTKPKARIEYFDISTHISQQKKMQNGYIWLEYFNKSCELKAQRLLQ